MYWFLRINAESVIVLRIISWTNFKCNVELILYFLEKKANFSTLYFFGIQEKFKIGIYFRCFK